VIARKLSSYQQGIRRIVKRTVDHAVKIENIMRDDILHTVTLDWLNAAQFETAARKPATLLDAHRADYEEYFAGTPAIFEQIKAAQTTPP
jgi:hypothetical protein